jgi:hypothetical protein
MEDREHDVGVEQAAPRVERELGAVDAPHAVLAPDLDLDDVVAPGAQARRDRAPGGA